MSKARATRLSGCAGLETTKVFRQGYPRKIRQVVPAVSLELFRGLRRNRFDVFKLFAAEFAAGDRRLDTEDET